MFERTLEEMVEDCVSAQKLTRSELGRALQRKEESKKQAACCRVKLDELDERMEELRIRIGMRDHVSELAKRLAATPLGERLAELDLIEPVVPTAAEHEAGLASGIVEIVQPPEVEGEAIPAAAPALDDDIPW